MSAFTMLRPLVLLSVLAVAAVTDAVRHKVYNSLIGTGMLAVFLLNLISPITLDLIALTYSLSFILVTLLFFARKRMGGADVKLYMLTALAYPDRVGIRIIVLSVVFGAIYSLWIILKRHGNIRNKIPMGIFLFAGAVSSLLI